MTGQSHPVPYTGRSKNSAKIMQDLYDGVYTKGSDNNLDDDYLAIENAYQNKPDINGADRRKAFKKIIDENPIRIKNKDDVTTVLTKSMVEQKLFVPSLHLLALAIDLRISRSSEKLLEKHNLKRNEYYKKYKKEMGSAYKSMTKGDPHIHISYLIIKQK